MTLIKSTIFHICFWTWSVNMNLLFLPALIMPRKAVVFGQKIWALGVMWLLKFIVKLNFQIITKENFPKPPFVLAIKHQSIWDTIILHMIIKDPAIVMKDDLLKIPIYGWYCKKSGMIPIDRKSGSSALKKIIKNCKKAKDEGRSIAIFPQGTRVLPNEQAPYLPGITAIYKYLNIPVLPVALNSGLFWPLNRYKKYEGTITVSVLNSIQPGLSKKNFKDTLESSIEEESKKLAIEAIKNYPNIIKN